MSQEKCTPCSDEKPEKRIILHGHPASNLNAPEGIRGIAALFATGENTSLQESTFRICQHERSTRYDRTAGETFLNRFLNLTSSFPSFPGLGSSSLASPGDGYPGRTVSNADCASGYRPSFSYQYPLSPGAEANCGTTALLNAVRADSWFPLPDNSPTCR